MAANGHQRGSQSHRRGHPQPYAVIECGIPIMRPSTTPGRLATPGSRWSTCWRRRRGWSVPLSRSGSGPGPRPSRITWRRRRSTRRRGMGGSALMERLRDRALPSPEGYPQSRRSPSHGWQPRGHGGDGCLACEEVGEGAPSMLRNVVSDTNRELGAQEHLTPSVGSASMPRVRLPLMCQAGLASLRHTEFRARVQRPTIPKSLRLDQADLWVYAKAAITADSHRAPAFPPTCASGARYTTQ